MCIGTKNSSNPLFTPFYSIASKPATLAYGTVVCDFRCLMTDSILKLAARLISVNFGLAYAT